MQVRNPFQLAEAYLQIRYPDLKWAPKAQAHLCDITTELMPLDEAVVAVKKIHELEKEDLPLTFAKTVESSTKKGHRVWINLAVVETALRQIVINFMNDLLSVPSKKWEVAQNSNGKFAMIFKNYPMGLKPVEHQLFFDKLKLLDESQLPKELKARFTDALKINYEREFEQYTISNHQLIVELYLHSLRYHKMQLNNQLKPSFF